MHWQGIKTIVMAFLLRSVELDIQYSARDGIDDIIEYSAYDLWTDFVDWLMDTHVKATDKERRPGEVEQWKKKLMEEMGKVYKYTRVGETQGLGDLYYFLQHLSLTGSWDEMQWDSKKKESTSNFQ